MRALVLISALIALASHADSARILGLFPHTGRSHQMVFEPLFQKLTERGHHITIISFFPIKDPPANYTDISLQGLAPIGLNAVDMDFFEHPNRLLRLLGLERIITKLFAFKPLDDLALDICQQIVKSQAAREALKRDYDVVLVEAFNSDCLLCLANAYGIKAPLVGLSSTGVMPWSADRIGVGDNPSYVPQISTTFSSKMTFLERLENTILNLFYKLWYRHAINLKEQEILEKHLGRKLPDFEDVGRNLSLLMVNTHHTLNGVRPLIPGVIEVGGMHLDPVIRPIPPYMERFLNESEHGVVLFSFGSLIRTSSMPQYKKDIFINALSKLKQRVIWKYEDSEEEGTVEGNILMVKWLPQYELLQHPKVLAFLAHGGLLGMTEAIAAGKPMVVVPFFGDQPNNGAMAEDKGLGKMISYGELNEKMLSEALQKVLSAEMRLSARQASKKWHDRPAKPIDTAVYWTERVIRWGTQSQLLTAAKDMTFVERTCLDVAATIILAILALIVLLIYILVLIPRLLGITSNSKKEKLN